mmetsp:Transcript_102198/g.287343  ORF Transcript_102198/g.287343 Transcript_102198/m.287343 type:complete len:214 (+) Transcript_102198:217-858(+)
MPGQGLHGMQASAHLLPDLPSGDRRPGRLAAEIWALGGTAGVVHLRDRAIASVGFAALQHPVFSRSGDWADVAAFCPGSTLQPGFYCICFWQLYGPSRCCKHSAAVACRVLGLQPSRPGRRLGGRAVCGPGPTCRRERVCARRRGLGRVGLRQTSRRLHSVFEGSCGVALCTGHVCGCIVDHFHGGGCHRGERAPARHLAACGRSLAFPGVGC